MPCLCSSPHEKSNKFVIVLSINKLHIETNFEKFTEKDHEKTIRIIIIEFNEFYSDGYADY